MFGRRYLLGHSGPEFHCRWSVGCRPAFIHPLAMSMTAASTWPARVLSNDGSLACDLAGVPVLASGGASAMIELTRQVYVSDVVATLLANTTASTTLAFTDGTDMYTAPNTQ
jgi:hypothetical protein